MAHPLGNDGHGLRRFKTKQHHRKAEGTPWDSASTAANNILMAPASAVFVETSSLANSCSNDSVLRPNKSTACACKCRANHLKETRINSVAGEANAPQASCDGALKIETAPLC